MSTTIILQIQYFSSISFFLLSHLLCAQTTAPPKYRYLHAFSSENTLAGVQDPARLVEKDGRSGLHFTSITGALPLPAHTLNEPRGTVSIWVMPLEDLAPFDHTRPNFSKSNPHFSVYPILSDAPNPQDYEEANFKLIWRRNWHPSLIAHFAQGKYYEEAFDYPHRAVIGVSHFTFQAHRWYQLTMSWNYDQDQYALYVNGILVGKQDQYHQEKLYRDPVNRTLYLGNPTLSYSQINFYEEMLTPEQVYQVYRQQATAFDQEMEDELRYTYRGENRKPFQWSHTPDWQKKFDIPFTKPSDLDSFYVQGNPVKVAIQSEGLLVETIDREMTAVLLDSQVYLWSHKPFEGDLYVEYEFKVLRRAGLSLLMVQASGMNREDFMADYPLRTSGRMTTVYGEDVRNYHWEYYREMADMTNDVNTSALMKNPFAYPLSFGSSSQLLALDTWHKLQFLQVGDTLIGAINGVIMVEATDNSFINNGAVYNFGRIAIRNMLRTKMLFRNLKVYNRQNAFRVKPLPK